MEYTRFKYSNPATLLHNNIIAGSEKVVSFFNAIGSPGNAVLQNGLDYSINYTTGQITMLANNWLTPLGLAASY